MLDYQHTPSGLDLRNIGTFNHTTQDAGKVEVTATATTFPLQFPVPTKSISSKDGQKKSKKPKKRAAIKLPTNSTDETKLKGMNSVET